MALVIGVPQYIGHGPLGTAATISSPTVGATGVSATVVVSALNEFQDGNQVLIWGTTGGTGTWNATFYGKLVGPLTIALFTTQAGAVTGASGYTSTLTGAPTVTNGKLATVLATAGSSGWYSFPSSQPIIGKSVIKGDGSITTATINFVDGTVALPAAPSFVDATMLIGGTADDGTTTAETVLTIAPTNTQTISTTSFIVNFSAALSSNKTATILFRAYK